MPSDLRYGVFVAASDYVKALPDSIDRWLPRPLTVLGTDGFGRSDYRRKLRWFFEVDRNFVAVAALKVMADSQLVPSRRAADAIDLYHLDPEKRNPMTA